MASVHITDDGETRKEGQLTGGLNQLQTSPHADTLKTSKKQKQPDNTATGGKTYRDVRECDASLRHLLELALVPAEVHGAHRTAHATTRSTTTSPVEEEEKASEGNQREEEVAQQGNVVALLIALRNRNVNAILGEDVDQLGVTGQHDQSTSPIYGSQLHGKRQCSKIDKPQKILNYPIT